ncbi:MAG: hypothetical protein HOV68_06195 [Streptomycetaceae bacterium]|nr:hypothetical protein [Streptomycetaceae bacterium]
MQGQPSPGNDTGTGTGKDIGVRIAWSLFPILSLGLLGWVPMLVLALRRRTQQAWGVFVTFAVGAVLALVLVATDGSGSGSDDGDGENGIGADVGGVMILTMWVGGPVYWFITTRNRGPAGYQLSGPGYYHPPTVGQPVPGPAYAWPQPQYPPNAAPPATAPPAAASPAAQPADAHAERARARLEGLSERLREREAPGAPGGPGDGGPG